MCSFAWAAFVSPVEEVRTTLVYGAETSALMLLLGMVDRRSRMAGVWIDRVEDEAFREADFGDFRHSWFEEID